MLRLTSLALAFLIAATCSSVANADLVIHDFSPGQSNADNGVAPEFSLVKSQATYTTMSNTFNSGTLTNGGTSYTYTVPGAGSSSPPPTSTYFVRFTYNIVGGDVDSLNAFPDEMFIPLFATNNEWVYDLTVGSTSLSSGAIGTVAGTSVQFDASSAPGNATQIILTLSNINNVASAAPSSVTYGGASSSFTLTAVPEPTSALMFGSAVIGLVARRRRKTA